MLFLEDKVLYTLSTRNNVLSIYKHCIY